MRPAYRLDPFTGEHVLVAPRRRHLRSAGPDPLAGMPVLAGPCPFCPGNEAETEATLAAIPARGPWRVRVVANRFPLAGGAVALLPAPGGEAIAASGVHEVILETPAHDADLGTLDAHARREVLAVMRERVSAAEGTPSVEHVCLFRNRGRRAGSSQPHPHSQLVGSSMVGPAPGRRWGAALAAFDEEGRTLLDRELENELAIGARVVAATDDVIAFVPFAPSVPFETWLVPRRARGSFSAADDRMLFALADALGPATEAARAASGRQDYNLIWHLPPVRYREHPAAFFAIAIVPRGASGAGLELSTGTAVVTVSPEEAAEEIRARFQKA